MTFSPDALALWPVEAGGPAARPYRRELRRPTGPTFREGPRGVFRAHYLRCGLCQGWRPFTSADLRAWRWDPTHGTAHTRCLKAARSRGTFDPPGGRPGRPDCDSLEGTPLEQRTRRERRRRRGAPRRSLELLPWDGPQHLETFPGWTVTVAGASRDGLAVLAAPVAQLVPVVRMMRAPRSRKLIEVRTWQLQDEAPAWYELRRLRPVT